MSRSILRLLVSQVAALSVRHGGLAVLWAVTGCGLDYGPAGESTVALNACSSNSECGSGSCRGGICQTNTTALSSVLLSVTPPAATPTIAGVTFLQQVDEFELGTNGVALNVDGVSRIGGTVVAEPLPDEACVPQEELNAAIASEDGSIPHRITLIPRSRLLGIPNPTYTSQVSELNQGGFSVSLPVPPGRYDVYVEPGEPSGPCVRPPYLALDQEFISGEVEFRVTLPEPEPLRVKVLYPGDSNDLQEWTVDILERSSGRLLSNRTQLSNARFVDGGWEYEAKLAFTPSVGSTTRSANELVRLAPPDGIIAPEIFVERSVVDLFREGEGLLDQLSALPDPVLYQARVATNDATEPSLASLRIIATALDATAAGTIAKFSRTVETDEDGLFEVELLPGEYRVLAEPWDERLAPQEIAVSISDAKIQAGKTIEVRPRPEVRGRLQDFSGDAITGIAVGAQSLAANQQLGVLGRARGLASQVPLATQTTTQEDGRFSLLADAGTYAFFARPQATSQFAWRILLGVQVAGEATEVGTIRLPLPVAVDGTLTSQDVGALEQALIVAYAFLFEGELTDEPSTADAVIPIAEARSGDGGAFRLLLPSSFK